MSSVRSGSERRRVSAAILAGGRASRFGGTDKSALRIGGERIIDRQLAALAPVSDDVWIVSHDRTRYAGLRIPVIPDAIAGAGPMGGLHTALQAATHPWVVIVACDLPFVTAALFETLVQAIDEETDAVMPRSARGLEPLCAIYAQRLAPAIGERAAAGQRQMVALAADLRVTEIGPETLAALNREGRLFENVNTPHDYARAVGAVKEA